MFGRTYTCIVPYLLFVGASTRAASYVELVDERNTSYWGVGIDEDVTTASLQAVLSAASRAAISQQAAFEAVMQPDTIHMNGTGGIAIPARV